MRPGQLVSERFEIQELAGSGGMGVVYKAIDLLSGGAVALKVLLEVEEGPADRFAHEVELLSALEHPHIVGYVTHGATEEGSPYLVMPWLEGTDLQARLDIGPLSIPHTLALARRVASALSCLHARGLVHRDLKPSNLFLPAGDVERVQVIDLGVARSSIPSRALTLSGVLVGTPGFIAPEQARGEHEVAPAVDIFALGCVLYECLTGRRLFTGTHLMSVLAKILLEDAPRVRELRPEVPEALDALVQRMVAKDPERRPRDGTDLARYLLDLDNGGASADSEPPHVALTGSERRMMTVLVVVLPPGRRAPDQRLDETRIEGDPFVSSARFGVRAQLLAERTAVVVAHGEVNAADQASVLARFARYLLETVPGARLALTTGSALAGARLPVGDAIDRAVTMVRAPEPAEGVEVDDVTAALLTSRFDIRRDDAGLKVQDERLSLDPTRPLLGRPTSCVGRERELSILETTFASCAEGSGPRVVLVTAAAGAGKSRLRHELLRRLGALPEPPAVFQCRGDPLHVTSPYSMLAHAVRQAADLRDREPPERVRDKLLAHVTGLVPEGDAARVNDFLGELVEAGFDDQGRLPLRAARADAAAMADQVCRAFEDILRAWCARRSVVLVLEDLHWGDVASTRLLDRVLGKLTDTPLFVLALARPEVHERFPALFARREVTEIRLPPIPRRACAKLVHDVMGEEGPRSVVDRIVERSEGNGFYLEELIRAAAEGASRVSTSPREGRRSDLPETVIAVAQARLERLEPRVRKVLRAASIFGDVFWLEGVSALVGEEPAAVEPLLRALLDHEAIVPAEHPRLAGVREMAFRHTLLRGTAYASLTDEDRSLGHRLAARWLEQVREDGEVVALHWLEGGDRALAAASYTRAGELRWSRAQSDAAARCAVRALLVADAAREPGEAIHARMRLLATALRATRSVDVRDALTGLERFVPSFDASAPGAARAVVEAAVERSLAHLRAAKDDQALPLILGQAACALGALGDFAGAKLLLEEANLRGKGSEVQLREVRYASARVAFLAGEGGAAVDLLAETVLPEEPRARLEILLILAVAVVTVDGREALARGLDFVSRAEAILAAQAGEDARSGPPSSREDPVALVHCAKARLLCFYLAGDYAAAGETAEAAVGIARRAGLRFDESAHLHNAGEMHLRGGHRERARAALLESNRIARDLGAERTQGHNDLLLAYLDGDADRLRSLTESARAASDPWLELHAYYWLGHQLASAGSPDARRALERGVEIAGDLKVRTMAEDCARLIASLDVAALRPAEAHSDAPA